MKSKTKSFGLISLCLVSIASTSVAFGQESADSLSMDVTFVGEREMVVKDAIKLQSWPEPRRLDGGNRDFEYKLLSKRLNVVPEWTLLEPVRLRVDAPLARLYRGYARAGYGIYNTPLLEVSLTDLRSREGTWGFSANHFATDVPSDLISDRYKESGAKVWTSKFIGKEKVDLSAHLDNNAIAFYGNPVDDSLVPDTTLGSSENYLSFGTSLGLKSHHRDSLKLNHEAGLSWVQLIDGNGTVENNLNGDVQIRQFVDGNKVTVTGFFNVDRLTIGANNPNTVRIDAAVMGLEPTITTYEGNLTVLIGAGLWVDADAQSRLGDGQNFHFYPTLETSISLMRDLFIPYLRLDGRLEQNRLQSVLGINPFYYADVDNMLRTTNRKYDIDLGMRGTITDAVSFNIHAGSTKYEDYMYFKNDSLLGNGNRFSAFFDTLQVNSIGGDLNIDLGKKFDIRVNAELYKYDANGLQAAWNLPSYTATLDLKYTFLDKFSIKSTTTLVGERHALTENAPLDSEVTQVLEFSDGLYDVTLPAYVDLNLNLEYRYNYRTAIWVSLNNLTGTNYRHWAGYPVQGTQALFGASYAF